MKQLITLAVALAAIVASRAHAQVVAGPLTNDANGHVYYLLAVTNWPAAEAQAAALGGHLATVNDTNENTWIFATFATYGGVTNHLWIGLTDQDVEGTFRWVSGETADYRNWASGEPNNTSGNEDFCMIFSPPDSRARRWNDAQGSIARGVVEVIPGVAAQVAIFPAVEIAWPTQTTNTYQIQWSSSLNTNDWFNLGAPIQGTGSTNFYFDSTRGADTRFYRVLTLQP
jgi:hypothetical protein